MPVTQNPSRLAVLLNETLRRPSATTSTPAGPSFPTANCASSTKSGPRARRWAWPVGGPPRTHPAHGTTATLGWETPVGRQATAHNGPDRLSLTKAPESGKSEYCASCQRHWVRAAEVHPLSRVGDHSQCSPHLAGRALKQNRRAAEETRPADGMGKLISARISKWPNSNHSS